MKVKKVVTLSLLTGLLMPSIANAKTITIVDDRNSYSNFYTDSYEYRRLERKLKDINEKLYYKERDLQSAINSKNILANQISAKEKELKAQKAKLNYDESLKVLKNELEQLKADRKKYEAKGDSLADSDQRRKLFLSDEYASAWIDKDAVDKKAKEAKKDFDNRNEGVDKTVANRASRVREANKLKFEADLYQKVIDDCTNLYKEDLRVKEILRLMASDVNRLREEAESLISQKDVDSYYKDSLNDYKLDFTKDKNLSYIQSAQAQEINKFYADLKEKESKTPSTKDQLKDELEKAKIEKGKRNAEEKYLESERAKKVSAYKEKLAKKEGTEFANFYLENPIKSDYDEIKSYIASNLKGYLTDYVYKNRGASEDLDTLRDEIIERTDALVAKRIEVDTAKAKEKILSDLFDLRYKGQPEKSNPSKEQNPEAIKQILEKIDRLIEEKKKALIDLETNKKIVNEDQIKKTIAELEASLRSLNSSLKSYENSIYLINRDLESLRYDKRSLERELSRYRYRSDEKVDVSKNLVKVKNKKKEIEKPDTKQKKELRQALVRLKGAINNSKTVVDIAENYVRNDEKMTNKTREKLVKLVSKQRELNSKLEKLLEKLEKTL